MLNRTSRALHPPQPSVSGSLLEEILLGIPVKAVPCGCSIVSPHTKSAVPIASSPFSTTPSAAKSATSYATVRARPPRSTATARCGGKCPAGKAWRLATHIEDVPEKEIARRSKQRAKGRRLNLTIQSPHSDLIS